MEWDNEAKVPFDALGEFRKGQLRNAAQSDEYDVWAWDTAFNLWFTSGVNSDGEFLSGAIYRIVRIARATTELRLEIVGETMRVVTSDGRVVTNITDSTMLYSDSQQIQIDVTFTQGVRYDV